MRLHHYCQVVLALVFLQFSAFCFSDTITDTMRKEDARLEKTISFTASRIYVGELLEQISKRSGVVISASERDGATDEQVFVCLVNTKLGDCLDALWSLLSYKDAEYYWARTGEAGRYQYKLGRSQGAQKLAGRLLDLTQELFEKQANILVSALNVTPNERKVIVQKMVHDLLAADGDEAKQLVKGLTENENIWAGLSLFANVLSPEQQKQVLRGENIIRKEVSELPEKGRDFVKSNWEATKAYRKFSDGHTEPVPIPTYVAFYARRQLQGTISPTMFIQLERIGGYGYLGGVPMEKAIRKKVGELWRLKGDLSDHALKHKIVQQPEKGGTLETEKSLFEMRLKQTANNTPVTIMARLPDDARVDPGLPFNQSIQAYLERLDDYPPYFQNKWRHDVLLIDYPGWFQDDAMKIPLAFVKRLRQSRIEHNGYFYARDLAAAANFLQQDQLRRLAAEFPVLNQVADFREVWVTLSPNSQALNRLLTAQGLPLTEEMTASLKGNMFFKNIMEQAVFDKARIKIEEHPDRNPASIEYTIGLVTNQGRWVPVVGMTDLNSKSVQTKVK